MKNCVKQTLKAFGEDAEVMVVVIKDGAVSVISDSNKGTSLINHEIEKTIDGILNNLNSMGR